MLKFLIALFGSFTISTSLWAGGMSGGSGFGRIILELADELRELLQNASIPIDPACYRRLLLRLSVDEELTVRLGDREVRLKLKYGEIVDTEETFILVPYFPKE